jgi:hypothetical protein
MEWQRAVLVECVRQGGGMGGWDIGVVPNIAPELFRSASECLAPGDENPLARSTGAEVP